MTTRQTVKHDPRSHRLGLGLVALAAMFWSLSGFFTRSISADLTTMLFWRGLFSGTGVLLVFLWVERGHAIKILRSLRWPAFVVAVLSTTGMLTGIGAFRYGSVADAMVIYATVPFVTAGVAFLTIGERPSRSTLIASGVALCGIIIMLWGSSGEGGTWFGKLLACITTISMASLTTLMRRHREVAMLPAMALSGYLCTLFCFVFADTLQISGRDFMLCATFGIIQNASGLALYVFGSRLIPAAEATLLAALEVPFAPLWVWLVFGETPAPQTLLGGAVVLTAMFGHIVSELRNNPKDDPQPFQASP